MTYKWASWLHNRCRLEGPQHFRADDEIISEPQVNKWLDNPYRLGLPTDSEQWTKSKVPHSWGGWLHNPCCAEGQQHFKEEDQVRFGPQVGPVATQPLPIGGSPPLHSEEQSHKQPTCGPGGYIAPATCKIPNASKRATKYIVAYKRAGRLHDPSHLPGPQRFTTDDTIHGGSHVGQMAT